MKPQPLCVSRNVGSFSNRTAVLLFSLLIAIIISTVAAHGLSSRIYAESGRIDSVESVAGIPPAATAHSLQDEIRIQLSGEGFDPSEITHAAGSFSIIVENQHLTGEYVLQLKAENGSVVKELRVQKGSPVWGVELQPGQYTLIEASHPNWVCVITIQ